MNQHDPVPRLEADYNKVQNRKTKQRRKNASSSDDSQGLQRSQSGFSENDDSQSTTDSASCSPTRSGNTFDWNNVHFGMSDSLLPLAPAVYEAMNNGTSHYASYDRVHQPA